MYSTFLVYQNLLIEGTKFVSSLFFASNVYDHAKDSFFMLRPPFFILIFSSQEINNWPGILLILLLRPMISHAFY